MFHEFPDEFLPKIHPDARPFWDGCAQHKLLFQRCQACGHVRWPASIICPKCLESQTELIELQGQGSIYSFVIFRRAFHPELENQLPYIVATVDLDEGPILLTKIVGCDINKVYCGQRVEVQWQDVRDDLSLPFFRPLSSISCPLGE